VYFDFLEIAVPTATLPVFPASPATTLATDWDTEHSQAIAPERTAWLIDTLGFTREFILKNVLVESGTVNVAQIAMLWMGMPNKHDRKRTRQLLDALSAAGLLAFDEASETWTPVA
jgi:hypothetical protein